MAKIDLSLMSDIKILLTIYKSLLCVQILHAFSDTPDP